MNAKSETNPGTVSVSDDWRFRSHVRTLVLMAATVLGIYLCYLMALPFLPAITWALALAVLFSPFQRRLEARRIHPGLAAAVSVSCRASWED